MLEHRLEAFEALEERINLLTSAFDKIQRSADEDKRKIMEELGRLN